MEGDRVVGMGGSHQVSGCWGRVKGGQGRRCGREPANQGRGDRVGVRRE